MSGGSHDYLCHKDADEMLNAEQSLKFMAERLREEGYEDVAKKTDNALSLVKKYNEEMTNLINDMYDPWHAMEWYDSCDIGQEQLDSVIAKWRIQNS